MKRIVSLTLIFVLALSLFVGCAGSKGILGNATWDMSMDELKKAVGEDKIIAGSNERVLNWMQTTELKEFGEERTVSVGYVFTEDKLTNITVQIFLKDGETVEAGLKTVRAAMDKAYGASTGEDDGAHWHLEPGSVSLASLEGSTSFIIASYSSVEHTHE